MDEHLLSRSDPINFQGIWRVNPVDTLTFALTSGSQGLIARADLPVGRQVGSTVPVCKRGGSATCSSPSMAP